MAENVSMTISLILQNNSLQPELQTGTANRKRLRYVHNHGNPADSIQHEIKRNNEKSLPSDASRSDLNKMVVQV
jgi:hypothetical protein